MTRRFSKVYALQKRFYQEDAMMETPLLDRATELAAMNKDALVLLVMALEGQRDALLKASEFAYQGLCRLTTDEFQKGGDWEIREQLRAAINGGMK